MAESAAVTTVSQRAFHAFSFRRLWALATNTFTQLLRMKALYFLAVFSVAIVALAILWPSFKSDQELKLLKDVSLAAMNWFTVLFAIAATAMLLPRDVEDRTLYTILCKPVPRIEYLLGRWLGVMLLIGLCLVVMNVVCTSLLWWKTGVVVAREVAVLKEHGAPPEDLARTAALYSEMGPTWNLQKAILGILFQGSVMASLALLLSTFATSTLFTIISSFAIFIIGHGQGMVREYLFKQAFTNLPIIELVVTFVFALAFPDLKQFNLIDDVVSGSIVPWLAVGKMASIALMYTGFYLLVSWFVFSDKEL